MSIILFTVYNKLQSLPCLNLLSTSALPIESFHINNGKDVSAQPRSNKSVANTSGSPAEDKQSKGTNSCRQHNLVSNHQIGIESALSNSPEHGGSGGSSSGEEGADTHKDKLPLQLNNNLWYLSEHLSKLLVQPNDQRTSNNSIASSQSVSHKSILPSQFHVVFSNEHSAGSSGGNSQSSTNGPDNSKDIHIRNPASHDNGVSHKSAENGVDLKSEIGSVPSGKDLTEVFHVLFHILLVKNVLKSFSLERLGVAVFLHNNA